MRKTPLKNPYIDRLAKVNDQLCYFHFADEEIRQALDRLQLPDTSVMTTDVFPDNEFSPRIHVRFDSLFAFREQSKSTIAGISVTFGVEHLLSFVADVIQLKCAVSGVDAIQDDTESIEDFLSKCLNFWGVGLVSPITDFLKTIKYLRLRRNHIAHARTELTDGYRQFIRQNSHHLNKFWNARTSMDGLDFSNEDVFSFSEAEAYTCMKLLRVCVEEVDFAVAETFDESDLVLYLEARVLEHDSSLKGQSKRIVRKICRRLDLDFGVRLKPETIMSCLGKAGDA